MRTSKVFLVICIFATIHLFVSAAFAGKPDSPPGKDKPPPRTNSVKYGYAILEDGNGNVITSDGYGQYVDIENDRPAFYGDFGDKTRVRSYDDNGEYVWLRAFLGKAELPYRSPRRAMFGFDIYNDVMLDENNDPIRPGEGMAVYDILSNITPGGPARDLNENGGTVHLAIAIGSCNFFGEGNETRAIFLVDPGCVAEPPAITQTSVNAFYPDNDPEYWTAIQGASITPGDSDAHDQVAYHFLVDQLDVAPSDEDGDGQDDMWEITPKPGPVTLQVYENVGKKNRARYRAVPLATYASMKFKVTLSLSSFEALKAPGRPKTLSTVWGGVKADR